MGLFGRRAPAAPAAEMETVIAALLALPQTTSFLTAERVADDAVQIVALSVDGTRRPDSSRAYSAQLTLRLKLKPARAKCLFKSIWHEQNGFSRSHEVTYGRESRIVKGAYFSPDGISMVRFDTREVHRLIDEVLAAHGWR